MSRGGHRGRRVAVSILCATLLVFPMGGIAVADEAHVAMVVAQPGALLTGEIAVRDRLLGLGHTVAVVDDGQASAADAAGADLVIVGSSVNSAAVGATFRDVAATVWVAKPWLLDDMGMTGPVGDTDYGSLGASTVTIFDPAHPMAAGLSGTVTVSAPGQRVSYGYPGEDAEVVATAGGAATTFAYRPGSILDDGSTAPGCRITSSIFQNAPATFTDSGWSLFDAAVAYAVGGCGGDGEPPPPPPPPVDAPHVILISVDGLRPDAVTTQGPPAVPNIYRFIEGGATTSNARTLVEETQTLPNHLSMVTGTPVAGAAGHGVTFNEDDGTTVHLVAGRYVASIFDIVHDNGLSTSLFAGKPKFDFIDRSWDATFGAPDVTGADDGRDKIDTYQRGGRTAVTDAVVQQLESAPANLTMIHYADPDAAGHAFGWSSPEYLAAVRDVDVQVGRVLDAVAADPNLAGDTVMILTSDHGGTGDFHADEALPENFTVPFYVLGEGVTGEVSIYALNPASRLDPGAGRPGYGAVPPPIRNADAANLIGSLLGLGPIPGSTINAAQDLVVSGDPPPDLGPTVSITAPPPGATVSGTVVLTANASAPSGIARVEFFADAVPLGVDVDGSDGWTASWDTTTAPDGPVTVSVTATDGGGLTDTDSLSVTVANSAPSTVLMVSGAPSTLLTGEQRV